MLKEFMFKIKDSKTLEFCCYNVHMGRVACRMTITVIVPSGEFGGELVEERSSLLSAHG